MSLNGFTEVKICKELYSCSSKTSKFYLEEMYKLHKTEK